MPKNTQPKTMCFDAKLVKSKAFRSLSKSAILVLFDFLTKRQMAEVGKAKRKHWEITNNGELQYTYREAEGRGIPRSTFMRVIDELIEKGFLSVEKSGKGVYRSATLYRLDDRWRDYDTKNFKQATRPKGTRWGQGKENLKRAREKNSIPKNGNTAVTKNGNTEPFSILEMPKNGNTGNALKMAESN